MVMDVARDNRGAGRGNGMLVDWLPADRTVCPNCWRDPHGECRVCNGTREVCPRCFGARRLRDGAGFRPAYRHCDGCMTLLDGRAVYSRPLEEATIARERAALRSIVCEGEGG